MTPRGRANKPKQIVLKPQTKGKQGNQVCLLQQGDHNARQDPQNPTIRQRTTQNTKEGRQRVTTRPHK